MDIKIEEISGKKKRSVKLFEDNKKWLITGATVLLIVVGFILCGSRKETELSKYLGMSKSGLGRVLDIEYVASGEGYTLYSAKNDSIFIEVLDSDQRVHCIASRYEGYKLFGLKLGITSNVLQHGLEQNGFNADRVYEDHGFFSRGECAVGYILSDGQVVSSWVADNKSIVVHELISLGKRMWMRFA